MIARPRIRQRPLKHRQTSSCTHRCPLQRRRYATVITTSDVPNEDLHATSTPIIRHPPNAPPSHKPAFLRKSQLHRQYSALIRSTPLMLLFQHNNLKANEWSAVRRELSLALYKTSAAPTSGILEGQPDPAASIRIQTIQKSVFGAALRVVEFYKPENATQAQLADLSIPPLDQRPSLNSASHALSREAYLATLSNQNPKKKKKPNARWRYDHRPSAHRKKSTPLHKLLHGPIAVLQFPSVTPQHLSAALSILAPTPGATSAFPAPRRKANPGYYEGPVQAGLQKLVLLGARVEGRTMDGEGVRWVGGLASSGGLEGLRAQLVAMLQGVGGGITGALEGAGKSLWVTMESRRLSLEEGEGGGKTAESGEVKEATPASS